MGERDNSERCPGGYLIHSKRFCGPSGNRCAGRCAFAYRQRTLEDAVAQQERPRP